MLFLWCALILGLCSSVFLCCFVLDCSRFFDVCVSGEVLKLIRLKKVSRCGFMRICAAHFFELVLYCLNDIE